MTFLQKFLNLFSPQKVVKGNYTAFGSSTYSGEVVSPDSALSETAVYSCTRLISSSAASLPLNVYQKTSNGRIKADNLKVHKLVSKASNPTTTAMNWKWSTIANLLLYGNSYTYIDWLGSEPSGFYIVNPADVTVEFVNSQPRYKYKGKELTSKELIHFKAFCLDGLHGLSVIEQHKHKIGESLAAVKYGSNLYRNGARLSGVLEHPSTLTPEARMRIEESWKTAYSGSDNAFKTALLEEGLKFNPLSLKPSDMEYIETRKFNKLDICNIFGVPPHMLGANDKPTYASVEQAAIEFLNYTISPLLILVEQTLNNFFFPLDEEFYFEFNTNAFLKADIKARYEAYKIGFNNSWLSANDIRTMENLNLIEGGDTYYRPLNMTDINNTEDSQTNG